MTRSIFVALLAALLPVFADAHPERIVRVMADGEIGAALFHCRPARGIAIEFDPAVAGKHHAPPIGKTRPCPG